MSSMADTAQVVDPSPVGKNVVVDAQRSHDCQAGGLNQNACAHGLRSLEFFKNSDEMTRPR